MKRLTVEKIADITDDIKELDRAFSTLSWNAIDQCPWESEFPYRPEVRFQMAHSEGYIYLRYEVKEEFVKGQYIRPNENVWEDSCVEFFFSLDGKKTYYNFEFNVLATGLIGYGPADKAQRNRLPKEVVERIDARTQVVKKSGVKSWEIYLIIPKDIFGDVGYAARTFHANFYKCGDGLPNPHFMSWNAIQNATPNFHLPEFFGEVFFV
ncbi:carbohydrate-binding family 9-like protein [Sphingobacterium yanglingense]|uniref:Cellulose/xylan binding protein with CBM9 domain n=1 Tax=Sphingobacterium yanglingense TaxID=1437280 RepID=A0A4R6WCP5_9SPHI|nr:carbohydrate-binding family 9-like protein [Sphingobacterium yanglingense]TDQ77368.1 cellulose/xylan binding protein with CBM9 domain [Sphingobacterium yanglingense]